MRRSLVALVIAAILGSAATADAATSRWDHCSSYSVVQHEGGYTYTTRLYGLRVQRVSCQTMRHVLHRYFFGSTRPAGSSPSDGVWAGQWQVALLMNAVLGDYGRQHFRGHYTVT